MRAEVRLSRADAAGGLRVRPRMTPWDERNTSAQTFLVPKDNVSPGQRIQQTCAHASSHYSSQSVLEWSLLKFPQPVTVPPKRGRRKLVDKVWRISHFKPPPKSASQWTKTCHESLVLCLLPSITALQFPLMIGSFECYIILGCTVVVVNIFRLQILKLNSFKAATYLHNIT